MTFSLLGPMAARPYAIGERPGGSYIPSIPLLSGQNAWDSLSGYYSHRNLDTALNPVTRPMRGGARITDQPLNKVAGQGVHGLLKEAVNPLGVLRQIPRAGRWLMELTGRAAPRAAEVASEVAPSARRWVPAAGGMARQVIPAAGEAAVEAGSRVAPKAGLVSRLLQGGGRAAGTAKRMVLSKPGIITTGVATGTGLAAAQMNPKQNDAGEGVFQRSGYGDVPPGGATAEAPAEGSLLTDNAITRGLGLSGRTEAAPPTAAAVRARAGTPDPENSPGALESMPDWTKQIGQHLKDNWGIYAGGGLGLAGIYALSRMAKRKRDEEERYKFSSAHDFEDRHPFAAGFLRRCGELDLTEAEIEHCIEKAAAAHPMVRDAFGEAGLTKEARKGWPTGLGWIGDAGEAVGDAASAYGHEAKKLYWDDGTGEGSVSGPAIRGAKNVGRAGVSGVAGGVSGILGAAGEGVRGVQKGLNAANSALGGADDWWGTGENLRRFNNTMGNFTVGMGTDVQRSFGMNVNDPTGEMSLQEMGDKPWWEAAGDVRQEGWFNPMARQGGDFASPENPVPEYQSNWTKWPQRVTREFGPDSATAKITGGAQQVADTSLKAIPAVMAFPGAAAMEVGPGVLATEAVLGGASFGEGAHRASTHPDEVTQVVQDPETGQMFGTSQAMPGGVPMEAAQLQGRNAAGEIVWHAPQSPKAMQEWLGKYNQNTGRVQNQLVQMEEAGDQAGLAKANEVVEAAATRTREQLAQQYPEMQSAEIEMMAERAGMQALTSHLSQQDASQIQASIPQETVAAGQELDAAAAQMSPEQAAQDPGFVSSAKDWLTSQATQVKELFQNHMENPDRPPTEAEANTLANMLGVGAAATAVVPGARMLGGGLAAASGAVRQMGTPEGTPVPTPEQGADATAGRMSGETGGAPGGEGAAGGAEGGGAGTPEQKDIMGRVTEAWGKMDTADKVMMGLGVGAALYGLFQLISGKGGIGSMLMTLLGGGMAAGQLGVFGEGAQGIANMPAQGLRGLMGMIGLGGGSEAPAQDPGLPEGQEAFSLEEPTAGPPAEGTPATPVAGGNRSRAGGPTLSGVQGAQPAAAAPAGGPMTPQQAAAATKPAAPPKFNPQKPDIRAAWADKKIDPTESRALLENAATRRQLLSMNPQEVMPLLTSAAASDPKFRENLQALRGASQKNAIGVLTTPKDDTYWGYQGHGMTPWEAQRMYYLAKQYRG